MNKDKFFIGIGLPKTGSTWIYSQLQKHPEVQLPPIKEIRYFLIKQKIGKTNLFTNLFNNHRLLKEKRIASFVVLIASLKQILKLKRIGCVNLYWLFRYFCLPQSEEWYKKLFPPNKLSGDISPLYIRLPEKNIEKIKQINSNIKIIIGIRNPIDRVWSATKMELLRNQNKKSISEVNQSDVLNFFNIEGHRRCITHKIKKWQKHFPKEQILIYYFDELQEDPQKLFNKICQFLEIEPIEIDGIDKKVNKGIVEEIPAEYEKELIRLNYKYIEALAKEYPNKYSLAWFEKYKNKL